jgi:hypothetical protein
MVVSSGIAALDGAVAAFAGGVIGAAIGALPALALSGVALTVGELAASLGPSDGVSGPAVSTGGGSSIAEFVGLGPLLGPHVAFAGGVAAAAYAGRKGYLDGESEYHPAKHIATPPELRPDVLAVGGVFGILGHALATVSGGLGLPWSPIWASVVVSAACHRVAFGYPLLGRADRDRLDMSPFRRGLRRTGLDGSPDDGTHRYVVEPWLPHYWQWSTATALGAVAGIFAAGLALLTGSQYLAFGLATAVLLAHTLGADRTPVETPALPFSLDRVPVTHHIALPAGVAALSLPSTGPAIALLVGTCFGVLGSLCGELAQRIWYAHGDTHFDPAAVSLVATTFLLAVLELLGIVGATPIPTFGLG